MGSEVQVNKILDTEYSHHFDELRKNRMIVSYYKYGAMKDNYKTKLINTIVNLEKRLDLYKQTGNTEYLVDVANFAMIEFMYPQHEKAHFNNESYSPGLGGMTIKDIQEYNK